jgi:integrase
VADLIARFDAEHISPRLRKGTARAYRLLIRNHIAPHFGAHLKVTDVAFADVDALHRKVTRGGSTYAANRCLAVLSKMFALAIRWGMRDSNPVRGIERNPEAKRKRYLSNEELAALTKALATHPDPQVPYIIRLLLLTGARSSEVMGMRWTDIDLTTGTWTKPASTTKQKSDHTVPLSAPARQLLSEVNERRTDAPWVFPSGNNKAGHVVTIERAWTAICKAAGIAGLRVHDLRHSFASQLASGGASLPLVGSLLGHSNAATTHRYTHLFQDPQRAAVERVGAVIDAAGKGDVKEPTPLLKRGRHGR